ALARPRRCAWATALPDAAARPLVIHGALDRHLADPLLAAFRRRHPGIATVYHNLDANALYQSLLAADEAGTAAPDLLLSPAMDLQMKLANDGHAQPYASPHTRRLPDWARWRHEVFAYAFEPVVIAYHRQRLAAAEVPASRFRLIGLLRQAAPRRRGRVASYDPARSGAGYLYLTQDAELSPVFWELVQALGASRVRLYATAAAMLDDLEAGAVDLAYDLPGRYAAERAQKNPAIGIVLPDDYTLLLSRLALIPRRAARPQAAGLFLDFLLSDQGQALLALAPLPTAAGADAAGQFRLGTLDSSVHPFIHPIRANPGLLVYLDPLKRRNFLRRWQSILDSGGF
ncbi:MAG: ABC transporter substrate-binding protein, partial [Pseudomonadota bacterium]|nr:ABC transporter substrate-binding protein [Pseudomonadota bacterium]